MRIAVLILALAAISCSDSPVSATTTPAEQLQGDWEATGFPGDQPDGAEIYITISIKEDRFSFKLSVVTDEEPSVLLETIFQGIFSATEDSLTMLPDTPTEIRIDGLDIDTYLRKQFEDAGLEVPPDSVMAEIKSGYLFYQEDDFEPITTAYGLQGNRLTIDIDGEGTPVTFTRREDFLGLPTSAKPVTWGRFKNGR